MKDTNSVNESQKLWLADIESVSAAEYNLMLSGEWRLMSHVSAHQVISSLKQQPKLRILHLYDHGISYWDSGLIVFLIQLFRYCQKNKIEVDSKNLSRGVQVLLSLLANPHPEVRAAEQPMTGITAALGYFTIRLYRQIYDALTFLGDVSIAIARLCCGHATLFLRDFGYFLYKTGAQALPIVSLIAFLTGLIIAFISAIQLRYFKAEIYVANLVVIGMARELGAMMTAIIMAGRTGAAFAAELGTMKVNDEISALKTFGISPIEFLVLPRMLAFILMMPLLCLYADFAGILGGAVVGVGMLDINFIQYIEQTRRAATISYFNIGLVKGFVYGLLIVYAGCLKGIQCKASSEGVGEASTAAVVLSIVLIISASAIMNVITYILDL